MKVEKIFSIKFALVALFMLFSTTIMAQVINITGTVVDDQGEVVIGATVREVGTQNATVTDFDGNFSIQADANGVLSVSYVGFLTQEIKLAGRRNLDVTLHPDNEVLEEVVVVGYGVQKKKLVTGATVQVKGDDIAKLNTVSPLGALQSQTPGVQITQSNGQHGDSFKVNIRGIGTTGNSAPLYVIDGVAGGDLGGLNASDIESIDVLKDAASAAIYGARAANGVILVTTKQGKAGSIQVSYDGFYGWQYLAKNYDVADAKEYIYYTRLKQMNGGNAAPDYANLLPSGVYDSVMNGEWKGTDWIGESYHKGAPTTNHAVNIAGGNELSKFSLGLSYTGKDGILGGETQSHFERYTARLNSDHVIYNNGKFDVVKVGENMTFNHRSNNGISQSNMYWNNVHDLLHANPLLPAFQENGEYYDNQAIAANGWGLGNAVNPLLIASHTGQGINDSRSWNINLAAYLEVQPLQDLKWRSQFSYRSGSSTYRAMTKVYSSGTNTEGTQTINQNMDIWSTLAWENTISYAKRIKEHSFDVVVGNSIEKNAYGMSLQTQAKNSLFADDWDRAYLSNAQITALDEISLSGYPMGDSSLASFFGRVSYNFAEKYMLQGTVRTDGSSNFMRGHRWGIFPSASVGWVITNENFMQATKSWLDFFKLRASWGQNGNCAISNFQYLSTYAFSESDAYFFGLNNHSVPTTGGYADVLKNEDVSWETSEQLNIGFDARFIGSRLGVNFDWYKKTTRDWLVQAPILSVYGLTAPYVNGGDVVNKGFELGLTWDDHIGDFTYGVQANFATNKNEVTRIANAEGIIHGPASVLHQQETEIFRAQVGEPIGFFYGFKTAGVFQNLEQIEEWNKTYSDEVHGTLKPGDVIYVDTNGDNKITEADKTNIGDPHPDFTLGFGLNMAWKGFDLSVAGAGAFGQQICRTHTKGESTLENISQKLLYGSWKGEGTSNFLPRLDNFNGVNWMKMSSIWLEDADYVKIQNITVGYDFARLLKKSLFSQLRLYASAQNLFTFTNYSGVDPEIGADGGSSVAWAAGIDNGYYPSAKSFLVGVNIKFADKKKKKVAALAGYPQPEPRVVERVVEKVVEKIVEKPVVKEVIKEIPANASTAAVARAKGDKDTYVVTFAVNSSEIANKAELDGIAKGANVEVVAYASPEGNADANKAISQKRADAVANYLKSKGVNVTRVEAKGADTEHANRIAIVTVK